MCGILYIEHNNFNKNDSFRALNSMNHRGPDNQSSVSVDDKFFGHARLSIIDLDNRSNQPFQFLNYTIIFNGEIYNYKELIKLHSLQVHTSSDTEVLLKMYIKYGRRCLQYLNGMFTFVIYNSRTNSIFVARDRLGIKPLYYRFINNKIIIASEINAILSLKNDELSSFGLRQYKKLRMTIKRHTVYKNIKQFPPGHYFDGATFQRYWDLEIFKSPPPKDDELEYLIKDAVNIRKRADVPVGSYLSGGLDSTIISFILNPSHTWTVGFKEMNEFKWSLLASNELKSNHNEILINPNQFLKIAEKMVKKRKEPLSVPNEVLLYKMTKAVKKNNTVVLSGEGADELFWGYDKIFKWANKVSQKKIEISEFDKYYCYGTNKDDEVLDFALEGIPGETVLDKIAYYFQIFHLQGLLRRLDNSTMLCSVEARVPFVDHRLVELMAGVPFDWRMGSSFKEPLKRVFRSLIPQKIIERKKIGFPVPLEKIFKSKKDSSGMDDWLKFNLNVLKSL
jgi:asparagine synthase (glutamine-hydrolysing)